MAENSSSPSKNQILSQVKDLCLKGKFTQSRELICQAAGITGINPMSISRNQIRKSVNSKQINQMLDNETILFTCANKISTLDIGSKDKYQTIKSAFLKTPKESVYGAQYKELLDKYSRRYFDEVSRRANHPSIPYPDRSAAFETAIELVNDFNMSAQQRCAYKIGLLNSLEDLQRQHGDKQNMNKTSARKQNFIFKSAQLKKQTLGYRIYNENYR